MDVPWVVERLHDVPPWLVWVALFAGAFVEYVFPPFPGDTVVVGGAALVGATGFPIAPVFVAVTAGAVAGAAADLYVGRKLVRRGGLAGLPPTLRDEVLFWADRMKKHGAILLVVNRFVPGVRALFFVAAGMAGLRTAPVLFWATVSASLWNGSLIALGLWAGSNLDVLTTWVERYALVAGVVVAGILLLVVVRSVRRIRSR